MFSPGDHPSFRLTRNFGFALHDNFSDVDVDFNFDAARSSPAVLVVDLTLDQTQHILAADFRAHDVVFHSARQWTCEAIANESELLAVVGGGVDVALPELLRVHAVQAPAP